jgi:hypothetical protein
MGVPVKVPVEVSKEVLNSVHAIEVKKGCATICKKSITIDSSCNDS